MGRRVTITIQKVKEHVEAIGHKLLTEKYISCSEKLDIICSQGHQYRPSWDNLKRGHYCPTCAKERNAVKRRLAIEEIRRRVEAVDYRLLDGSWVGIRTKRRIECERSHVFEMSINNLTKGQRCHICYQEHLSIQQNKLIDLSHSFGIDTSKHILQNLCSRNHDWNETGKSLYFADSRDCVECNKFRSSERYRNNRDKLLAKSAERQKETKTRKLGKVKEAI